MKTPDELIAIYMDIPQLTDHDGTIKWDFQGSGSISELHAEIVKGINFINENKNK